jgi:HlyD family secretion protein
MAANNHSRLEQRKRRNRLIALGLVIGALALALWGLRTPPIAVDMALIKKGDIVVTTDEEGITRIREIYRVSAPVTGLLRRLSLKEGDRVIKGKTVVAVIEPLAPAFQDVRSLALARAGVRSAQAALALARAELSRAEAELDYAGAEYKRTLRLYRKGVFPRKTYDAALNAKKRALAALEAARAQVDVRQKELERAKASLIQPGNPRPADKNKNRKDGECCLSIFAPATGRVLRLLHKSEQVVSAGTALLEIGDDRDLEIAVDLLSREAVKISPGAPALIEGWGGGYPLRAHVRRIEPAGFTKVSALGIEEQRVRVILDLDKKRERDKPIPRLGHDFRVFVHIEIWRGKNILLAPLSALFRQGDKWMVFVAENGRAHLTRVEIGRRDSIRAEVKSGLKEGEKVIIHPSDRIEDGVRIKQRKQ